MDVRATGKTKVFRNSRQGRDGSTFFTYNASLSKKNQDGSYDHANLEVRFRRGMEPTAFVYTGNGESIDIDIKDGFLTFRKYQTQDGQSRSALYIMVMDYESLVSRPVTSPSTVSLSRGTIRGCPRDSRASTIRISRSKKTNDNACVLLSYSFCPFRERPGKSRVFFVAMTRH